jgi:hypothetical protein
MASKWRVGQAVYGGHQITSGPAYNQQRRILAAHTAAQHSREHGALPPGHAAPIRLGSGADRHTTGHAPQHPEHPIGPTMHGKHGGTFHLNAAGHKVYDKKK